MGASLGYALRRTSARVVLAFVAGSLVLVVYSALRPVYKPGLDLGDASGGRGPFLVYRELSSSPWDLAAGSLFVVVALVVAAFLWYERPTRR